MSEIYYIFLRLVFQVQTKLLHMFYVAYNITQDCNQYSR